LSGTSVRVVIGMDPHKRSATIEVMTGEEVIVGGGRFGTDRDGYRAMLQYARRWPGRVWAIEGCQFHTKGAYVVEAGLVGRHRLQQGLDAAPHRPPARTQLAGDPGNAGMLTTDLIDRPPARPHSSARGLARRSSCSVNVPTAHAGSGHSQRRLSHRIRTGRPKHGMSTNSTTRRP
jgi:hypothetical protein